MIATPVAWLYTDIEGSTRLWQAYPDLMPLAYERHDAIVREVVAAHGGTIKVTIGDAFQIFGPSVWTVTAIAIATQIELKKVRWPMPESLRVRMAIDGPTADDNGPSRTPPLECVLGAAHGDQILLTSSALDGLSPGHPDWSVVDCGGHLLRGFDTPVRLHQITTPPLRTAFPPLTTRSTHPSNLPEIARLSVAEHLTADHLVSVIGDGSSRWITLIGPSLDRLLAVAIETARRLRPTFPGGTFLVADSQSAISSTIAAVLDQSNQTVVSIESVAQIIGHSRQLLVLADPGGSDRTVAELAYLLGHCPELRLLVVATEPLGSRWERIVMPGGGDGCVQ